jgi:hypothetical protein
MAGDEVQQRRVRFPKRPAASQGMLKAFVKLRATFHPKWLKSVTLHHSYYRYGSITEPPYVALSTYDNIVGMALFYRRDPKLDVRSVKAHSTPATQDWLLYRIVFDGIIASLAIRNIDLSWRNPYPVPTTRALLMDMI